MAYENINVKMSRTGNTITWGFSLRQDGPNILIAYVEKNSMADKAGLQINDSIEQIFGIKPTNIRDLQNKIKISNEINMQLKRFVAVLPELPWTLEESGNQVIVNQFDNKGNISNVYDKNSHGYQNSFHTTQSYNQPTLQESYKTTNYKKTNISEGNQLSNPLDLPYTNTISSESHSNWDKEDGNIKKHFETNRSYTRTESTNVPQNNTQSEKRYSSAPFTVSTNNIHQTKKLYDNNNQYNSNENHWMKNQNSNRYNFESNATPISSQYKNNQENMQNTKQGNFRSSSVLQNPIHLNSSNTQNYRNARSVTPAQQSHTSTTHIYDGPKVYYQRTPRTARELSPHATIQHLQYNSPLAMYSPEIAAEQYKMQTGKDLTIDGDYPTNNRPVYLDSATRRAIAEEEQGFRYRSPTPQQSNSFKRISNAVGTPVN